MDTLSNLRISTLASPAIATRQPRLYTAPLLGVVLVFVTTDKDLLVILLMTALLVLVVILLFAPAFASRRRHSGAFAGSPGIYTGGVYSLGRRQVFTKTPAPGARRR